MAAITKATRNRSRWIPIRSPIPAGGTGDPRVVGVAREGDRQSWCDQSPAATRGEGGPSAENAVSTARGD